MATKFYIFTEIDGIKNYAMRVRHTPYSTIVTMFTPTTTKAKDFGSLDKCTEVLRRMGIGYAIRTDVVNEEKESILEQIKIVEDNVSRLRVLVETDMHCNPNSDVTRYCCRKAILQLENIESEIGTNEFNK